LGLILVGCSRQRDQEQQAQQTPPVNQSKTAQPAIEGLEVGNLAPEIQGEDIDGKKFKLTDYRGKVVLLDFWAST
jgi:cytochrome oxidase Cu insertion factor (SCO1/SenC/PrrC family)